MKKTLLKTLTGILIFTSTAIAQPTLTATGTNPVIGESFMMTSTNSFNQGSGGANQTWNFSTLTGSPYGPSNCVSVMSTPNGSSFPLANLAFQNTSSSNYSYQKTSSTAFQNYGNVTSAGVVMSFSNPEDLLRFPMTYLTSYTDAWSVNYNSGGMMMYRTGTTTITADGYGTLIVPSGTYTNVMRIHMVQTYKDSADFGGTPYIINYSNDEYLWQNNSSHISLAATFTFTTGTTVFSQGFYKGTPVGIDEIDGVLNGFQLFPNPASDKINIGFNLIETSGYCMKVYNSLGQIVLPIVFENDSFGSTNIELDVTGLPAGIYFTELIMSDDRRISKRFVVSK